jgi:hypothetical protein
VSGFADSFYERLLSKVPYTHRASSIVPMFLLQVLLRSSHRRRLPGADVVAGAIGGRLIARLFTELPAQVTLLRCPIPFAPFKLDEAVPGFLDAYRALYNSAADLQWSAGFFARTRARLFNPREVLLYISERPSIHRFCRVAQPGSSAKRDFRQASMLRSKCCVF